MLLYQILAFILHGKILKSHTKAMKSRYSTFFSTYLIKHEEKTYNPSI